MWKKWIGVVWAAVIAFPCALSLNMDTRHAFPFVVAVLAMGIIAPNVDLGLNRFVQAALVGFLIGLPTCVAFGWWPLSAIAASCGVAIACLNERLSPLVFGSERMRIAIPTFRLRTLFSATMILAFLLAWHHHANGIRSSLRKEGIALHQRWFEIRPNLASIAVQSSESGKYQINGQVYDEQQAVSYLIEVLKRLRRKGIDMSEVELQSPAKDPYEQNRIWVLQQYLEGNGVAAKVSFRPEL